jgi:hypothetical protein
MQQQHHLLDAEHRRDSRGYGPANVASLQESGRSALVAGPSFDAPTGPNGENQTLWCPRLGPLPNAAGSGAALYDPQSARQVYTVRSVMLLKEGDKSGANRVTSFWFCTRQSAGHMTNHHRQFRGFRWLSRPGEAHDQVERIQRNVSIPASWRSRWTRPASAQENMPGS